VFCCLFCFQSDSFSFLSFHTPRCAVLSFFAEKK
jgi:hypothetical protein